MICPGHPRFARRTRQSLAGGLLLFLSGCATYQAPPLVVDRTGASLEARSLESEDLQRFLAQNLGHAPASWDFDALCWVAFYYNPALDVARAQWQSAQAAGNTAGAKPNPTLALTPGYNTSASGGVSPWFPGVTLDFLLETGRKRDLRAESVRLATEASRQAVFTAAWQIRRDLRTALLDFSVAQHRATALRAQAAQQQKIVTLLEQRLRAGAISAPEVSPARLAAVRAESAAADAERQAPLARQKIAQLLGLPAVALARVVLPTPVAPSLDAAQIATARRAALQHRADVLAALARFDASQSALALEIAKQRPDLHLGPGYQWDQGDNKWSLALTFELPLFNHNEGPIAEAEAHRRESAAQFLAAQSQVLAEIDTATAAQSASAAQIENLRRIAAELTAQHASTERRLRAGGADRLDVENALAERAVADLALIEATAQAASAAGQLEDALQIPFSHLAALAPSTGPATPASP